jgi:hypothetical protein
LNGVLGMEGLYGNNPLADQQNEIGEVWILRTAETIDHRLTSRW